MLGRRGKADPGRHPVRAAPEAAENRFRVCQEQEIETFPKWNVSCRCRMPGNSRTPVKVRKKEWKGLNDYECFINGMTLQRLKDMGVLGGPGGKKQEV